MKNVILFTIDTMRKDVFGCYGNKEGLTPFFDSLQDKMIIFNKSYSIGPYTQASFPGILTSSYYLEYDEMPSKQFSPQRVIVSELLRNAGIYTSGFHSNPYLCSFFGWDRGWDVYYDSMDDEVEEINPYIKGKLINEKVDKWLSNHIVTKDYNPFFLWVHYMDVHEPYVPDLKYREMFDFSLTSLSVENMVKLFKEVILKRDTSNPETFQS